MVQPLFKYIGGKTWLRDELRKDIQYTLQQAQLKGKTITRYVEPFAGGLGSFLSIYDILQTEGVKDVVIGDVSPGVIAVYTSVHQHLTSFLMAYEQLEQGFNAVVPHDWKNSDKAIVKSKLAAANTYFNAQKKLFNTKKLGGIHDINFAALFVFLQKHAFNGVYRENAKGEYNTPFNWSGKSIDLAKFKVDCLDFSSMLSTFQSVVFTCQSYEQHTLNDQTLVYADPPYANEGSTENKYHEESFNESHQKALIQWLSQASFVYSNHAVGFIEQELTGVQSVFRYVYRKNIMSANAGTKGQDICELLAYKI